MAIVSSLNQSAAAFLRRHNVHRWQLIRRIALPMLRAVADRDVEISHHWIPARIRLNVARHKGYWFHGKNREKGVMTSFARLLKPGQTVIELGSHIGYISTYFAFLVEESGRVYCFEPSPSNIPYILYNTSDFRWVEVIEKAVCDTVGTARFFIEPLTGQNDTLVTDYHIFDRNREKAFSEAGYIEVEVPTTTLDRFVADYQIIPHFVKIDIEGAELSALRGMINVLETYRPSLMIEVTRDSQEVMDLMLAHGYRCLNEQLHPVEDPEALGANRFFVPKERSLP